jgi:hypothetical protein
VRWLVIFPCLLLGACATSEDVRCFNDSYVHGTFVNNTRKDFPDMTYRLLNDHEKKNFIYHHNRLPPPTAMMFDKIGIFYIPGYQRMLVLFIEDGCVWSKTIMLESVFNSLIKDKKSDG